MRNKFAILSNVLWCVFIFSFLNLVNLKLLTSCSRNLVAPGDFKSGVAHS